MAFRPRTPTFRPQLSVRRVYETLKPRSEMKETPEAYLLHVYLPGFTKDRIKITFVDSSTVRVTGERPVEGNRWRRVDQTYPIPENSEADTLEGKFELGILILKMQKKKHLIPQVEETPQEKSPSDHNKAVVDEAAKGHEKVQETILPPPPQTTTTTTTKVEEQPPTEDKTSASLNKAQKAIQEDTSSSQTPTEPIGDHNPQKGQEEATKRHEVMGPKPQMGKEEFEPKPTSTKTTKTQTDHEKASKGQEEVEPKPAITTVTRDPTEEKSQEENKLKTRVATGKMQLEEKIVGKSVEDAKKERISKKEIEEEEDEKPSESRKPVKDMENNGNLKEKETRTGKLLDKEAEPSAPRVVEKGKESCRSRTSQEGKSGEDIKDIVGNGSRTLVASSFQVVTRIAEGKLNDEEKHLLENIGAAFLVIAALGAYVSYRFAS